MADQRKAMTAATLQVVKRVSEEFFGEGISHVGAHAALMAMSKNWESHLLEGASVQAICDDINAARDLLDVVRAEIIHRAAACTEVPRV
jgi:hypothetical protein